jgi:hypothetical protein
VAGQNFETFHWARAQVDVLRYYAAATPASARLAILRREGVTIVLDGPYERGLGTYSPRPGPVYRLLFARDGVSIYAVRPA